MMFSSNTCRFVLFSLLSLSANAESPVDLGKAGDYAILAKSGISSIPASAITGNIGVSPIAATAITGFELTLDAAAQFSTSTQLPGNRAYAASYGGQTAADLTTAVSNMEAAYTDAASRANTSAKTLNPETGLLTGFGFEAGVYTFGTDVVLDGEITFTGDSESVFIIRTTGSLDLTTGSTVSLVDGVDAGNIFWQVALDVNVGAGAQMKGVILAKTAVTFENGSTLDGRILTQTACVLQDATIVQPA
jgi:hypothetical protein